MTLTSLCGHIIDPMDPRPDQMNIFDIAHALAQIPRFSGQLPLSYSVAAHSLAVSDFIEKDGGTPEACLAGLLHDASEAYCQDVPTPIKTLCPDYIKIEHKFQEAIAKAYGIYYPFAWIVNWADQQVLLNEKQYQLTRDKKYLNYLGRNCEKEFLRRFRELGGFQAMRRATQRRLDEEQQAEIDESMDITIEQSYIENKQLLKALKDNPLQIIKKPAKIKKKRRKKRNATR